MPKSTLLLVHGMGKPTGEMFDQWKAALKKGYERYSRGERFEDRFDCVNIEYDTLFENRRMAWNNQIDAVVNSGVAGVDLPSRDDLEGISEDNFLTTHILDVLLYRFIPQIAEYVRAHVITQINDAIQRANSSSRISVIAHSLGTSVLLDAVNAMYQTPDENGNTLSPGDFRFQTIAMIANISRTLGTRWGGYDSLVRPGHDNSDNYVTSTFLSTSHRWDPLVSLRRFAPVENWPDAETVAKERVAVVEPGIITHVNVHGFTHYLENPLVNVPLFRMLRHKRFVSEQQRRDAVKAYHDANPIEAFDDYRRELRSILTGEADFSWKRLVEVFKQFQKTAKDFTA
ncbi:MAG: alpha/beta hydrolase [Planctomycetes bacterium]|nr:alpha/beta hydrolase [Planctomycetota bacterium]